LPENLDIFVTSDFEQWRVEISWHSRGENTEMIEVFIIELNESIDCHELCIGNASLSYNPAPAGYVDELRYIERSGPTRLIILVRSTNLEYSTTIEQWSNYSGEELPVEINNETVEIPISEGNNSENESNSSSQIEVKSGKSDNSLLVWGGAAGLVLLIGASILLLRRRSSEEINLLSDSTFSELSPIAQPVCTRCGGTTQVIPHQGHNFHWCGACQQYNT
jgi:LPXTG-motif cell wall-anchored protein